MTRPLYDLAGAEPERRFTEKIVLKQEIKARLIISPFPLFARYRPNGRHSEIDVRS
jgi:hypothetical protein